MDKSVEFKKMFEENVTATYEACNIIGAYSESLLALIDENYQRTINDETADLGVKLNTAVAAYNKRYSKVDVCKPKAVNLGNFFASRDITSIK